jgi:hypothetical protein
MLCFKGHVGPTVALVAFRIQKERGGFSGRAIRSSVNGCWPCIGVLFVERAALQTGCLGHFHRGNSHAGHAPVDRHR